MKTLLKGTGVMWLVAAGTIPRLAGAQEAVPHASVPSAATSGVTPPPLATADTPLVFHGMTVIDVRDGHRLPKQVVVIVGSRIRALGPAGTVRIPKGARVIDARGKYLIPGLWDLHVHPHEYVDIAYPLFIANGIVGVRDAGSGIPLATLGQWKREIAAGTRVGPRLLVSGPAINEAPAGQTTIVSWTMPAQTQFLSVPQALLPWVVDSLKAAGADFIKTYGLSREGYFAVAAAARRLQIPFGGHLPGNGAVDGRVASDSGARFLDHTTYLVPNVCGDAGGLSNPADTNLVACTAVAQQFRRNGTWVTLAGELGMSGIAPPFEAELLGRWGTRTRRYSPASFPPIDVNKYGSAEAVRATARQPSAVTELMNDATRANSPLALLPRAGMPIVVGTDAIIAPIPDGLMGFMRFLTPGFVLHDALVGFVLGGMTPLEALQTATLNAAQALHATDSLGTVEVGKSADLVLLDADPLTDILHTRQIRAVVADGRYYDRAALDGLLDHAEQVARVR